MGPTGTGKERVARLIHELGPRTHKAFVPVNCACLPDGLIESELFGHERGAFTNAIASRNGYVRQADGGTLFLDEIGEMSPHAQAKLLRVLECREVMPIGSNRAIPVDLRVVAATNQPLEDLVRNNQFRADLYYRLNVACIHLPRLRDRPEDIPLLFNHAVDELNKRDKRSVGTPDDDLLNCLMAYDWPGNIRELRNLVETLFIDPPSGKIALKDLPPIFRAMFEQYRTASLPEKQQLTSMLEETKWNISETAKLMKWSRMTLYRKLRKYEIRRSA
jgi:two-component system response regulator HydG